MPWVKLPQNLPESRSQTLQGLLLFLSHVKQGKSFSIGLFILSGGIWTTKDRVSEILNNVVVQAAQRCWRELCEMSLQHFKMWFWQSKTGRFISHPTKVVFELWICPKPKPLSGRQTGLISGVKLGNSSVVLFFFPHSEFPQAHQCSSWNVCWSLPLHICSKGMSMPCFNPLGNLGLPVRNYSRALLILDVPLSVKKTKKNAVPKLRGVCPS